MAILYNNSVGDLQDIYGQNKCRDFLQDTHLHKKVALDTIKMPLRFPHKILKALRMQGL
jgi:hypothetical protein